MLSCAEQNSRVPDGDGIYTRIKIKEVPYEKIMFFDRVVKVQVFFNERKEGVSCIAELLGSQSP